MYTGKEENREGSDVCERGERKRGRSGVGMQQRISRERWDGADRSE